MDDMIRRQDAIDALNGTVKVMRREDAEAVLEYLSGAVERLRNIPPAVDMINRKDAINAALEIIGDSAHRKAWEIVAMLKRIGKDEESDDNERLSEADR